MAGNKGKKYIIAIITPLLILAAAFFVVINAGQKETRYRLQPKESGYIDALAVYNSNKNYAIMKREIEEYAARINKELAGQLVREHNEAKRAQLKQQAEKEIQLYAETLLQDIDKDVDNAINEVAENKNLKRVYISGSVRQNGKNMTQAVITELNMTVMRRIGGYFGEPKQEQTKQYPNYERQFNFDSYPVAKVPEQGVTKEASGSLAANNKKGSIIADTQLQPKDKEERFAWKQKELKTAVKKAPVAKQSSKNVKTAKIYANAGKIELPSGKAEAIINGSKYALTGGIVFIQGRNLALEQMSPQKTAAKKVPVAKIVKKQASAEAKTAKIYANTGKIELPSGKAEAIINGSKYTAVTAIAYIRGRNLALTQMPMNLQQTVSEKMSAEKAVTKQQKMLKKTTVTSADTIALRPTLITASKIAELFNTAAGKNQILFNGITFIQARNAALSEMQMSVPKAAAKAVVAAKTDTKRPKVENKTAGNATGAIASRPSQITAAQITVLLNAATTKTHSAVVKLQEYTPIIIQNTEDTIASISAKCGRIWQKMYLSADTQKRQVVQTNKTVTDAATENVAKKQQPVMQQTAKEEKTVEAAAVWQMADKTTDIKQIKQQELPKTEKVEQKVAEKQSKQPKIEKAEEKPEAQRETKPVKTAEKTVENSASNIVSKPVTIQVAACLNKIGAEAAVKKLNGRHIPARVDGIEKGGKQWWCVRVTAADSAQANGYKQQLAAMGYGGVVVR